MDLSGVDVQDLVSRLELGSPRLTSGGREVNFDCFGPEHRDGGSAYINIETTAWMCHGCHRRGNAIGLVEQVHDVDRSTAERFLRDTYGIEFNEPVGGSMLSEIEARFRPAPPAAKPTPPPTSWLSSARLDWHRGPFEPFQDYALARGFSAETLEHFDIGYDYVSDRLTIPVFDLDGNLVGAKGRDWTGQRKPKYLILGDRESASYGFQPYESSEVVFGLHHHRDHRQVVLCEGELNAVALSQLGVPRPVAAGMSYFSERHAQLVAREAEEVVVFYDHGEAGHSGVWGHHAASGQFMPGVVQSLIEHTRVRVVEAPPEDPADLLQLGRGDEALRLIQDAASALASDFVFV